MKSRTENERQLRESVALALLDPETTYPVGLERPQTRGDCKDGPRPCPWAGCRFHLALDVHTNGNLQTNTPDIPIWEMAETCALDVADRDDATLNEIGAWLDLSRERVRQLETMGLKKLLRHITRKHLDFDRTDEQQSNAAEDVAPYSTQVR